MRAGRYSRRRFKHYESLVFQFRCLRTILKINVMHKILRATILEMCQVQDIILTMDLRRARWIEKLSHFDFLSVPSTSLRLLAIWQSIPSRLQATQDDWPLPHRQLETYRKSFVPRKRSSSKGPVHQKSWHYHRHSPNLPAVPTSAIGSLAIDNGEIPWARAWLISYLQTSSARADTAEKIQNHRRHRTIDTEQR